MWLSADLLVERAKLHESIEHTHSPSNEWFSPLNPFWHSLTQLIYGRSEGRGLWAELSQWLHHLFSLGTGRLDSLQKSLVLFFKLRGYFTTVTKLGVARQEAITFWFQPFQVLYYKYVHVTITNGYWGIPGMCVFAYKWSLDYQQWKITAWRNKALHVCRTIQEDKSVLCINRRWGEGF